MSYAAFWARSALPVPTGIVAVAALWSWINLPSLNGRPYYVKELSKAEFNATPTVYLTNPDHRHVAFPKVPGQASVPDGLADLEHKVHAKSGHHHH